MRVAKYGLAILSILFIVLCSCHEKIGGTSSESKLVSVKGPRPVQMAVDVVGAAVNQIVSYEDPVLGRSDVENIVLPEKSRHSIRALVPRTGQLEFTVSLEGKGNPSLQSRQALSQLIRACDAKDFSAKFKVIEVDSFYAVVPSKVKTESGSWVPAFRLLDSEINVVGREAEKRSGLELLETIIRAAGSSAKRKIDMGVMPYNLLSQNFGYLMSGKADARSAIISVFKSMGFQPGEIGWDLRYDINCDCFLFNLKISPAASERLIERAVSSKASMKCRTPQSEKSNFLGWLDGADKDMALFSGTLMPANVNFDGCWVTEGALGSGSETTDGCYFSGSQVPEITDVNSITGGVWQADGGNVYEFDFIGFDRNIDKYYLDLGMTTPCAIGFTQHMKSRQNGAWVEYKKNKILIEIDPVRGTVVKRDGRASPQH